jgi:hypothetical protein
MHSAVTRTKSRCLFPRVLRLLQDLNHEAKSSATFTGIAPPQRYANAIALSRHFVPIYPYFIVVTVMTRPSGDLKLKLRNSYYGYTVRWL